MRLDTVESSMLHAVGYDEETRVLEVIFNSGQIYFYGDVPPDVYRDLMGADSKGQYFQEVIKSRYRVWQLDRDELAQKKP